MKKDFTIPIFLFLAFLLAVYFVLPKYNDFKRLKNEVSKKESDLNQQEKYYLNLQKISTDLENYKDPLEKIESAVPDNFSLASLLNFFQVKASESGLVLKTLGSAKAPSRKGEVSKGKLKEKIKEHYISLSLIGTLPSFENFLLEIEKSSKLIDVENISLQKIEKELPKITVLVKVYSY